MNMQKSVSHILVIDDDTRIRDLLGQYLVDNGFFVSLAKDAKQARQKLKKFVFDLLVVDVMMPEETGVQLTSSIREGGIRTPVLMLTAMDEVEDRITGLECGADDYLSKPFEPRELVLRIQRILQRTKPDDKKILVNFGEITFDLEKGQLTKKDKNISLTSNEEKLMRILCSNLGKPISRDDLAEKSGGVNERSIDVQITRLRNKIEQDPKKPVFLKTVRGEGYILYEE